MHCVVIGGGLIGMLTARELALGGARVTLLERGETGRESSWAGGGILSPLYPWRYPDAVTALAGWSQQIYPGLTAQLHELSGIDPEWTPSGLLVLDGEDAEAARGWAAAHGIALEQVEPAAARTIEPTVGELVGPALWLPEVAQVRNPRLAKAMRAALGPAGVRVQEHTQVRAVEMDGHRVRGVVTDRGAMAADAVVVATGAWSGELMASVGLTLPVAPVRGQMILLQGPPQLVSRIVLSRDRYVIPRRDGRILVGSTLEQVGFDKGTTAAALAELRAEAARIVPALADLSVERHWAGLRPGSPTGVPFIGAHPAIANLFVNAGHFRNGVVLGPASARLLADLVLGRPPIVDAAPYRLP